MQNLPSVFVYFFDIHTSFFRLSNLVFLWFFHRIGFLSLFYTHDGYNNIKIKVDIPASISKRDVLWQYGCCKMVLRQKYLFLGVFDD